MSQEHTFSTRTRPESTTARTPFSPRIVQRKCACGGAPGPTGECEECKRKRVSLQPKLAINQPGDRYEEEADRVAAAIVDGGVRQRAAISSLGGGAVQREDPPKPKSQKEKYKEAAKKAGEAFLKTPPGKEIEKKAEELGDAFISTLPGKIITGTALAGAIATLAATHKELPIGIPEIPLDKIKPGLKMKITYEGPVDKPTKVMAGFSFKFGGGKSHGKKHGPTESEKRRSETARMAADQAKFREGLKSDEEKAADQKRINDYVTSKLLHPDQLTPRTSPLSFGVAGEQLGVRPGAPVGGSHSSLGPWALPDIKLTGETAEEPKKKEEETLQRKATSDHEVGGAPPIVDEVLGSPGRKLDPQTRALMERRFGHDFGAVRIHCDGQAAASARAVDARAFTVGRDVVFAAGEFAPESLAGQRLLAHELTHVLQQGETTAHSTADPASKTASVPLQRKRPSAFDAPAGDPNYEGPRFTRRRSVCLEPGSFAVDLEGGPNDENQAQGHLKIDFQLRGRTRWRGGSQHYFGRGGWKEKEDGKFCDCDCAVYRQFIRGVAFTRGQGTTDLQKVETIKSGRMWEMPLDGHWHQEGDLEHSRRCGSDATWHGCKRQYCDEPGVAQAAAQGTEILLRYNFLIQIWDLCQEKAVREERRTLTIAGETPPRTIKWDQGWLPLNKNDISALAPGAEEKASDQPAAPSVETGSASGTPTQQSELAGATPETSSATGARDSNSAVATEGKGQGSGPASVSLSTGTQVVHTPPCGGQTITATVAPKGLSGIKWSLHDDGTKVDAGTKINRAGEITLGNAQTGGTIRVRATDANGASADIQLILNSHPTDIDSTSAIGPPPNAKSNYGGTFDHVFKSNDGKVESLEGVAVGERFPNVPTPDAASHAITGIPFGNGNFTLTTATLTAGATNNWFLTKAGGLNGNHDRVAIGRAGIDVGQHIASTSNPKPANPLPAGFSVQQDLHWYCPAAAADQRWTKFKSIVHDRRLRLDGGGEPEFVVSVNKEERTDAYTGTTGVQKITATPATVAKSPNKGKANTVQISASALPSTRKLHFSLQGSANGCSINAQTGLLTVGKQAGSVTVRAANASGGANYDELSVTITDPAAAKTPPTGGTPTSPPGSKASTGALPNEQVETSGENRGFGELLFGLGQGPKEEKTPKKEDTPKKPASKSKKSAAAPSYKYKTGDLRAVPDWTYIAYPEQGKVLLRFFSSAAKIQIGTIGWITNNPGNIDYATPNDPNAGPAAKEAAKQDAYEKNPADTRYGRFAIFPTRATGVEAVLPVLGKYVESNPDLTVEDAVKRYKGSEKNFSDFKLLFPNEPMPVTEAEKKAAAARVTQAYADAVRGHIHDELRSRDKDLSEAEIKKRVEHIMTRKFSELDQSSPDARLLRSGLIEKEGGLITPGVEFSCGNGFTSMNLFAYSEPQKKKIQQLVSSAEAYAEMQVALGCDEKKENR